MLVCASFSEALAGPTLNSVNNTPPSAHRPAFDAAIECVRMIRLRLSRPEAAIE
jgi:hypothetical protein